MNPVRNLAKQRNGTGISNGVKRFLIALQFLTVIPIKIKAVDEKRISKSIIYFPLAGLLLGLILVGASRFLSFLNFEQVYINIILVISLVFLTAGMHLDGLADTADALLSRKNKEEMLRIMRDSHIGVMGVLAIISIILLKIAFLSSVNVSLKTISLLLMCTLSRWSLVLAMFLFPYARQEGKAKIFIQRMNFKTFISSTIIALVCTVAIWQLRGLFIIAVTAVSAYIIGNFINKKIGGITGDTLGAMNEVIEVIVLFSICLFERIIL